MEARSTWSPTQSTCVLENTFRSRDNITVTMASDIAMLIIMLVGLLHSRQTTYGVVRHLYVQVGGRDAPFPWSRAEMRLGLDMAYRRYHSAGSRYRKSSTHPDACCPFD
jgi:hypothetical protein